MHGIRTKSATATATANANADATLQAAPTDRRWRVHHITAAYSAAPTGGKLQILSGATVVWEVPVGAAVFDSDFAAPLRLNPNDTLTARLVAGGAAVTGSVNVLASLEL